MRFKNLKYLLKGKSLYQTASLRENSTNTIWITLDRLNAASEIVDVNETRICENHWDRG